LIKITAAARESDMNEWLDGWMVGWSDGLGGLLWCCGAGDFNEWGKWNLLSIAT